MLTEDQKERHMQASQEILESLETDPHWSENLSQVWMKIEFLSDVTKKRTKKEGAKPDDGTAFPLEVISGSRT